MYLAQLVALGIGAIIGSQLPDIDQWLWFLAGQHRSILTHSPLIPWGVYSLAQGRMPWWYWFGAGLAAAFAAHLARDLFPISWYGFATISIPLYGRLDGTLSLLWLLGSVIGCWYLALLLIRQRSEIVMLWVAALLAFGLDYTRNRGATLMPLIALVACYVVAICIPNPVVNGRLLLLRWYATAMKTIGR
ncbi:MAG: hypothetical protein HGA19_18030 [Oscillochloris sp.]|nr:hypothetical protein [Oscillochloris sp.]